MIKIGERDVRVVTGRISQTINVCFENPQQAGYEKKYRNRCIENFVTEEELELRGFDCLDDLYAYIESLGAVVENQNQTNRIELIEQDDLLDLETTLNSVVNEFLDEFVANPYRHRVEHSVHVQLFQKLANRVEIKDQSIKITGGFESPLVHKEWPEPITRAGSTKRGSHDLAIIPPCSAVSIDAFCRGFIKPYAAFELGLNYELSHFSKDVNTLHQAQLARSYVIHLARPESANQEMVIERAKELVESGKDGNNFWPNIALAIISSNKTVTKKVGQTEFNV